MTVDRSFWLACTVGGALVLAGCLIPTIEVGQGAYIGAGDAQQGFDYERTVRFAPYRRPGFELLDEDGYRAAARPAGRSSSGRRSCWPA